MCSTRATVSYTHLDVYKRQAADIGDNTIRAEIVATEHDVHTGLERILPLHGKIFHDLIRILPYVYHHAVLRHALIEQLRQLKDIVRAEDQIHEAIALSDLLHYSLLLHHAAAERDNHPRMLLLQAVQVAQAAIDTQIRVLANRAGIIDVYKRQSFTSA